MDKPMQSENEMQDEEIYALLDTAFDTERLTVSEELIQKTLRRVAEANEPKMISFEKAAKKRRVSFMKYASAAAAAVFVLVVGGGALLRMMPMGNKAEDLRIAKEEAMRNSASDAPESGVAVADGHSQIPDGLVNKADYIEYSVPIGNAESSDPATDAQTGDSVCWNGAVVTLSEDVRDVIAEQWPEVSERAECWEFVRRDGNWENELVQCLQANELQKEALSKDGEYVYTVACADGSERTIGTDVPLDLIVRIETGDGILWVLFEQTIRCYIE